MAKSLIASGDVIQLLASPDGVEWLSSFPADQAVQDLFSALYGICANSTYALAVIDTDILRSTDGALWQQQTAPANSWYAVGSSDTLSVAVGVSGTSPRISTSPDGINWTARSAPGTLNGLITFPLSSVPGIGVSVSSSLAIFVGFETVTGKGAIATSPTGVTWTKRVVPDATSGLFGVFAGSTLNVAVGNVGVTVLPYILTSPDGVTWTKQTADAAAPVSSVFYGVYGNGSLYVAVGSVSGDTGGLIQTSPDGLVWTQRTCPSRVLYLTSVTYNSDLGLWCAGGANIESFGCVITSPDGINWTYGIDLDGVVWGASTFNVVYPTGAYTTFIYDDCCHLMISDNLGTVWRESNQAPALLDLGWPDMSLPWVDGDYQSMASFAYIGFSDSVYDDTIKGNVIIDNGVLAISLENGRLGTWSLQSPDITKGFDSGAISGNGDVVLLMPYTHGGPDFTSPYMLLSTDGAQTFSHVATELGSRTWSTCCFSALSIGAKVMYAISADNLVSKSVDSGATWADLPNSPTLAATLGNQEAGQRIRCSFDGSIVILAWYDGNSGNASVYVSRDSGDSWTLVTQVADPGFVVDCGLSMDGQVMIYCIAVQGQVFISSDTGATWSAATAPTTVTAGTSNLGGIATPATCNVSPDGVAFCVGFISNGRNYANLSIDSGATWTQSFYPNLGVLVTSFIVPATPFPPPPLPTPTPTPTPETCVIADTDTFDYIFAFPDRGAFLRDTIVGPYAAQAPDLLIYNPVETALHLPFFYPRTTPTVPIPPTVPPGVPDVITPPVPVVGNPTVLIPQLADSSLYLPTYWAMITVPGPVVAALWNHPNLVLVNDRTLMRASQCSVVKTIVDVSHINIVFSNYGVYVYDGLCVSPCVIQTMQ